MVNENKEPVQAPLPDMDSGGDTVIPEVNPLIAEADRLNGVSDSDITEAPIIETPVAETPTIPQTPVPEVPDTPIATNMPAAPAVPEQYTPQQIQQMQQQAAQYQQVQQRASLQQEAQRYQQQLESQGYMPDQAQQISHQFMQSRGAQMDMMRQNEQQTQQLLGKQAAAEHFAKQHKLSFEDMPTLRLAETPEQMEQIAKKISDDRKVRDELAQLRKSQVPPQQFDNSQGAPEVAANDGSWLDRYNAGDRSPNATAAARRALGIE